jgi:hypothetical protein
MRCHQSLRHKSKRPRDASQRGHFYLGRSGHLNLGRRVNWNVLVTAPRNLCVVLVLDSPGANPFNLTLPANWGMEYAFAMPAQPNCLLRFPPAGSVAASGGMGTVTLPPTPQPTANFDVTLTFPPADAGAGASERLMANGVLGPLGVP